MTEQTYEAPRLALVGSLEALTQGKSSGNRLDANYANGTSSGQLTFS